MKQYYQLVRAYGKYGIEYTVYEAKELDTGEICIAPKPFTLVGNHPEDIEYTLEHIMKDLKRNPPVDKDDCAIWHDSLWHEDDDYFIDPEFDFEDDQLTIYCNRTYDE